MHEEASTLDIDDSDADGDGVLCFIWAFSPVGYRQRMALVQWMNTFKVPSLKSPVVVVVVVVGGGGGGGHLAQRVIIRSQFYFSVAYGGRKNQSFLSSQNQSCPIFFSFTARSWSGLIFASFAYYQQYCHCRFLPSWSIQLHFPQSSSNIIWRACCEQQVRFWL